LGQTLSKGARTTLDWALTSWDLIKWIWVQMCSLHLNFPRPLGARLCEMKNASSRI